MRYQYTFLSRAVKIALGASWLGMVATASAGSISGWNIDNVDVSAGPFVSGTRYSNTIYQDNTKAAARGDISWVHGDVTEPGISVVNGDDVDATNCIMSAGLNPNDGSTKQCSDPAGTNKHFELRASVVDGGGIDLVFDVTGPVTPGTYQVYQTFVNNTGKRINSLSIQLGFGTAPFTASGAGDGVAFSAADGTNYGALWVVADPLQPENLSGQFPASLYGATGALFGTLPAQFDTTRVMEDEIQFATLSNNYAVEFGSWLPLKDVPYGYFHDDDATATTPAIPVAYWDGEKWLNTGGGIVTTSTIGVWESSPQYSIGRIQGMAAFSMRFNITVGDITTWPTYDGVDSASFTISAIPTVGAGTASPTWLRSVPPAKLPAPSANADVYTTFDKTGPFRRLLKSQGVLANDSGVPGSVLTARLVNQGTVGAVQLNDDGTFTYQPGPNFVESDTFSYLANDGLNNSNTTSVFISYDNRGGGGGCAASGSSTAPGNDTASIDPILPFVVVGSIGYLIRRRSKQRSV